MAEKVGTLLWELRTTGGWSLAQLAQKARVSKSALSQWESGVRQPRVPELEATLNALGASPAQRVLVLARIEAPRAKRLLREPAVSARLGPPPAAGDLLRALRLRRGWTQAEVAIRVGVRQNTIARWESGERNPSSQEMQALCSALEAEEPELMVLLTGDFAGVLEEMPGDEESLEEYLKTLLYKPNPHLEELYFIALERVLWQQAVQSETARLLLAQALAYHVHFLGNYGRWQEVHTLATRVLELTPRQETEPDYVLRAALKLAAAAVYAGHRPAPERGLHLLQSYLPRSATPDYTAWMLSDMAKYTVLAGQPQRGVVLAREAVCVAEEETDMRRIDYSRLLVANGQPEEALRILPDLPEENRICVYAQSAKVEAYLALGETSQAQRELTRAYDIIEAHDLKGDRQQADLLAQRLYNPDVPG
jgi:transcriptional regulator with XRE-family HTH domain